MNRVLKFIGCIALPLAVGGISGFFTTAEIPGWYQTLQKPSFNPPNWVFGPVWTSLYILMGVSLYLVLDSSGVQRKTAITVFSLQLGLNFLWSMLFFAGHQISLALADIVLLWISILMMILVFHRIRKIAGLLQIPYLAWVSYATVLNAAIWYLKK